MPSINTPTAIDSITVDGTAAGYVTVADNTKYYPRAHVWLTNDDDLPVEYVITDLVGTTKIGLQAVPLSKDANLGRYMTGSAIYTRSSAVAWTVAKHSKIAQDRQVVTVENSAMSVKMPIIG